MSRFIFFLISVPLAVISCVSTAGCSNQLGGVLMKKDSMLTQQDQESEPKPPATKSGNSQNKEKHPALADPKLANKKAPESFKVLFETTKGNFVVEVTKEWSPIGAERFYNLVEIGFFEDIAIFRAIDNFMFQFGIHGDPKISKAWRDANIEDDPKVGNSNAPGTISFANGGPGTRSTQLFVNLGDNRRLDGMGFTPFGKVVEGMDVVRKINTEYGEDPGDIQGNFQKKGNEFILKRLPNVDLIKSVKFVKDEKAETPGNGAQDKKEESKK